MLSVTWRKYKDCTARHKQTRMNGGRRRRRRRICLCWRQIKKMTVKVNNFMLRWLRPSGAQFKSSTKRNSTLCRCNDKTHSMHTRLRSSIFQKENCRRIFFFFLQSSRGTRCLFQEVFDTFLPRVRWEERYQPRVFVRNACFHELQFVRPWHTQPTVKPIAWIS